MLLLCVPVLHLECAKPSLSCQMYSFQLKVHVDSKFKSMYEVDGIFSAVYQVYK